MECWWLVAIRATAIMIPATSTHAEGRHFFGRSISSLGLEADRLQLSWVSASEGRRYAEVVTQFDARIRQIGPNPLGSKESV